MFSTVELCARFVFSVLIESDTDTELAVVVIAMSSKAIGLTVLTYVDPDIFPIMYWSERLGVSKSTFPVEKDAVPVRTCPPMVRVRARSTDATALAPAGVADIPVLLGKTNLKLENVTVLPTRVTVPVKLQPKSYVDPAGTPLARLLLKVVELVLFSQQSNWVWSLSRRMVAINCIPR